MANNVSMISATLLAGVPEFVEAELGGLALRRAYSESGLPTGATSAPGRYIPEEALVKFMESAARQTGDDALGALFGTRINLGVYDTWGSYVVEAKTLGESLQRFLAVMRILSSHSTAGVVVTGGQARLSFRWAARNALGYNQVCCATAGSLLNTLRQYLGPTFLPDEIHLDIARPPRTVAIESCLPTRIFFDADEIALIFPKDLLKTPRSAPIAERPLTLSQVRRRVLTGPPRDIQAAVEEMIRMQVSHGGPNFDQTCRALNMNGRTLRRFLDGSGVGFRDLSNRIRLEVAEELLKETDMPLRLISAAVGYADPCNFSRAFKSRYGFRPTAARIS